MKKVQIGVGAIFCAMTGGMVGCSSDDNPATTTSTAAGGKGGASGSGGSSSGTGGCAIGALGCPCTAAGTCDFGGHCDSNLKICVTSDIGTGGAGNSGGNSGLAGSSTTGSGTAYSTGGSSGLGGAGGTVGTGGIATAGGTFASGGVTGTGGPAATGGTVANGGTNSTGGGVAAGGTTTTGAATGSGGVTYYGGSTGTGGASGVSVSTSTGGSTSGGGATGTGGAGAGGGTGDTGDLSPIDDPDCPGDCGASPLSYGAVIGSYRGVQAYSNGNTWACHACADGASLALACGSRCSYTPVTPYGAAYQCVEYVRRFYATVYNDATLANSTGNAKDYITKLPSLGFTCYQNSQSTIPPDPDDIVVFNGGGYGHIAIARAVSSTTLTIIQQNARRDAGDEYFSMSLSQASGKFTVGTPPSPLSKYTVAVWCRKPANSWQTCSTTLPCPDGYDCLGSTCGHQTVCPGGGNCSGHGTCNNGSCSCTTGWTGTDCATACSSNFCATNGYTSGNHCNGSTSTACSLSGTCISESDTACSSAGCNTTTGACYVCPGGGNCSGHGTCNNGSCSCTTGWTGSTDCGTACTPSWSCTWSACGNGVEAASGCIDSNGCGLSPPTTRSCPLRVKVSRKYGSNGQDCGNPSADWDHCPTVDGGGCLAGQSAILTYVDNPADDFWVFPMGAFACDTSGGTTVSCWEYPLVRLDACYHSSDTRHLLEPVDRLYATGVEDAAGNATSGYTCVKVGYARTGSMVGSDTFMTSIYRNVASSSISTTFYGRTNGTDAGLCQIAGDVGWYAWSSK